MKFTLTRFSQPAGDFHLAVMPAGYVVEISTADPRQYDPERFRSTGGIQRRLNESRVREIAEYCGTPDSAFPTAVILAVGGDDYKLSDDGTELEFTGTGKFANIVDGQHRVAGLAKSGSLDQFQLPVVLLLDATLEEQALLFATINGKQTKVNASLIFDLFGLTESRSPYRTAHEVARALNSSGESPWYARLKMLGRKSQEGSLETVTQGTFVRELLPHISSDPPRDFAAARAGKPIPHDSSCVFNSYFVADRDEVIVRVLSNLFGAQQQVWSEEWEDPGASILTKSTGFMGTMWALEELISAGQRHKTLTRAFFAQIFSDVAERMGREGITLTGEHFPSSSQGIGRLRDLLRDAAAVASTTPV